MGSLAMSFTFVLLGTLGLFSELKVADSPPEMSADLDGQPIALAAVADHYCHDFDHPVIHCFSSKTAINQALSGPALSAQAAFGPNDYVTVYSEPSYGGSFMHLSVNYDTLYWIGWNDRISSYKARNSNSGSFWENWYETGRRTSFCCNQTVPWLVASVDNTFTSVYRD